MHNLSDVKVAYGVSLSQNFSLVWAPELSQTACCKTNLSASPHWHSHDILFQVPTRLVLIAGVVQYAMYAGWLSPLVASTCHVSLPEGQSHVQIVRTGALWPKACIRECMMALQLLFSCEHATPKCRIALTVFIATSIMYTSVMRVFLASKPKCHAECTSTQTLDSA